ncbi:ATP-binding protein [soil metagenome]
MGIARADYELPGAFYLGRGYDAGARALQDDLVLYDSKDMVTHGVVLGMTGSGKTGLCLAMLEEAIMDGIPALIIDPKGEVANLMLTFPELRGEDFRPWINEDEARKKGRSPDEFARDQADLWRKGLADWGQGSDRLKDLKAKLDVTIYTPGSNAGLPVSILSSLEAPPDIILDDSELLGDRIESTVTSLLSLLGINADPIRSREHILLSTIFGTAWREGRDLDLAALVSQIQRPPFTQVGVLDVESFYPEKDRFDLSLQMNNLLAAPGFAPWLEGEALDVGKMLYREDGRARVTVFSIAHLSESGRMFFVSLLLNQALAWMRGQGGTTSLRALLYMDEIFGFLPPTASPPSKKPMITLLKQARAYGLGILLATQNPVDLDYKALSNIGTWFLGRLQTERDKMRVLEGLEGAATVQGSGFDRAAMGRTLAGLGSRVFLLNNVHEDAPVTFHVRWCMSYLHGPLTRRQIKILMGTAKDGTPTAAESATVPGGASGRGKPPVPPGIDEYFLRTAAPLGETGGESLVYVPGVIRAAEAHISDRKSGAEGLAETVQVQRFAVSGQIDWAGAAEPTHGLQQVGSAPEYEGARYEALPPEAIRKENYRGWLKDLQEFVYRQGGLTIFHCPSLGEYSRAGETEAEFRQRLDQVAREERDRRIEVLREKFAKEEARLAGKMERAATALEREKAQSSRAKMDGALSVGAAVFGFLLGRKKMGITSINRGRSASRSASRAWQQGKDVGLAEDRLEGLEAEMGALKAGLDEEIGEIRSSLDPLTEPVESVALRPYKKDIVVKSLGLVWLPHRRVGEFDLERAW